MAAQLEPLLDLEKNSNPFRISIIPNNPNKIQLSRISHVLVHHTDLDKFAEFAADFGFVEEARTDDRIYFRGFGKDPYSYVAIKSKDGQRAFQGGAFVAQTEKDFEKAKKLPGAVEVDISKAPGGGQMVELTSPGGGKVYVVWGQKEREVPERPPSKSIVELHPYNTSLEKFRKGEFQRFKIGPAMIHKLGHYGALTPSFDQDVHFYLSNFNFTPSDILHAPDNEHLDVLTFIHLDLGAEYSDHHSLFFQRMPPDAPYTMHHCSFEVDDFDTQLIGHEYLLGKGYTPVWGVGRHILGSQIFDYWKDSSGFTIEHYADGDLVNEKSVTGREVAGPDSLSVWGPPLPREFIEQ